MIQYRIGIDPGVMTGYAVAFDKVLLEVTAGKAIEIEQKLLSYPRESTLIYIEDARKRRWFGKTGTEVWKGAGSVMRDCQRWEEYCQHYGFKFQLVPPRANRTKLKSDVFKKLTGWKEKTNEHGRDAAMLIHGR